MTATDTRLPDKAQAAVDRFRLQEQPDPNPTPRPGNRAVHTTATRLWVGSAPADDGYGFMSLVPWRPSLRYGDWPMVVEWLRSWDLGGGRYRHFRLTYLEGAVYLAEYATSKALLADAWEAPDG